MNDIQAGLLELLNEIDAICSSNGITYYLGGGTALGAVRHNGFLPWDDDADLYITRDNWNKLLNVISDNLPADRELVCNERYEYYCNPIPRYMNLNTTWIYQSQMFSETPLGQHIEFLILDPMPQSKDEYSYYIQQFAIYSELLTPYFVVNRKHINNSVFDLKKYKHYCKRIKKEGKESVIKELEEYLYSFPESNAVDYHLRHGVLVKLYSKEYFGKPRLEKFENKQFPVASKAELVFRQAYGDNWKMIPDPQDRDIHNSINNLSIPYKRIQETYYKLVDCKKARNYASIVKQQNLKRSIYKANIDSLLQSCTVDCINEYSKQVFQNKKSYSADEITKFCDLQCMVKHKRIDAPFMLRSNAVDYYLKLGEYWKAETIHTNYSLQEQYYSHSKIQRSVIDDSRRIDQLLDCDSIEEAITVCHKQLTDVSLLSPLYYHAVLLSKILNTTLTIDEVENYSKAFPKYLYFQYYIGLMSEGDNHEKSKAIYQSIINESKDGILILKAKSRLELLVGINDREY